MTKLEPDSKYHNYGGNNYDSCPSDSLLFQEWLVNTPIKQKQKTKIRKTKFVFQSIKNRSSIVYYFFDIEGRK